MDLTIVAYATLALSLFVSAVKMGGWILNADPRAIINSGRWALIALAALALGLLVWLIATSRWTSAMMLAAFMLPVFVQAAPRWRVLFGPLNTARDDFAAGAQNFGTVPASFSRERERQRANPYVAGGGARPPGTSAERARERDQRGAPPARAAARSATRRHSLPEHEGRRGQRRSPRSIRVHSPRGTVCRNAGTIVGC